VYTVMIMVSILFGVFFPSVGNERLLPTSIKKDNMYIGVIKKLNSTREPSG
jgi:hypothetical protein